MTVLHVVAGLPPDGGGLSELVPGFCRGLVEAGCDVHLVSLDGPLAGAARRARDAGVSLHLYAPTTGHAVRYSDGLRRAMLSLVRAADVVHVHSNWTYPVWCASRTAIREHKPLVMSPQGCLFPERLRRSRWKKRLAGALFDRRCLRGATCLHATAEPEFQAIRAYGLTNPVAVIPNGIETGVFESPAPAAFLARFPACQGKRILLSLSRIHPIKGLDLLVAAWARLAPRFPGWHLAIAGPDEGGHTADLRIAANAAGLADRVTFCGPLYGAARRDAFAASDLFVLPSRNENFGIAVAEAAYMAKPVVATHGAPWEELARRGAGWWVPITAADLEGALGAAMGLDTATLAAMGARGREWVAGVLTWPRVARQLREVYDWLTGAAARPSCVRP